MGVKTVSLPLFVTARSPKVWSLLINSHSFMQILTNQKSRTVSSKYWNKNWVQVYLYTSLLQFSRPKDKKTAYANLFSNAIIRMTGTTTSFRKTSFNKFSLVVFLAQMWTYLYLTIRTISNIYNFKPYRIVYKVKAKYMSTIENHLQLWII